MSNKTLEDLIKEFCEKVESLDLNANVFLDVQYHFDNMIKSANFHSLCLSHGYLVAVFRTISNIKIIGSLDFTDIHCLLDDIFEKVHKQNGLSVR